MFGCSPLSALPPPVASTPDPSLVECPHCHRRYNEIVAERHIPKCRDIIAKVRSIILDMLPPPTIPLEHSHLDVTILMIIPLSPKAS